MKPLILMAGVLMLAGCAHPIRISPEMEALPEAVHNIHVNKNVAYVMSKASKERPVTTGGGGGDKVKYQPYRDLEAGLYRVLSNVFSRVYVLETSEDTMSMEEKDIVLIFKPAITTTSSSTGTFTWPPTDFMVTIAIEAVDRKGKRVWSDTVTGLGKATYSEFKHDFALAGKRASAAALKALQEKLLSSALVVQ
ncbi:MAG TPA: hypothetical protein PLQ67_08760 [Burkholderiaceae bacterium]|nr:hypothetical protein [Burkholderiaceae bacterium]